MRRGSCFEKCAQHGDDFSWMREERRVPRFGDLHESCVGQQLRERCRGSRMHESVVFTCDDERWYAYVAKRRSLIDGVQHDFWRVDEQRLRAALAR